MGLTISKENGFYLFRCPWCFQQIAVHEKEVNCTIFRHLASPQAIQSNPHATEAECKRLKALGWVGCSKPFKFNGLKVEKCGYI